MAPPLRKQFMAVEGMSEQHTVEVGSADVFSRPSKEEVRLWLQQRRSHNIGLPSMEDLKRELNWGRRVGPGLSRSPGDKFYK